MAAAEYLTETRAHGDDIDEGELGGVESPEFESQVLTRDGRVVSGSGPKLRSAPLLSEEQATAAASAGALFVDVVEDDEAQRALATPLDQDRDQVLVVVAELDSVRDAQEGLLRLVLVLAPLASLLAGAAGWRVARHGLRPVARMTADADALSAEDLTSRLALPHSRDEVFRLGTTLNSLLTRIQEARRRERDFTADASHEARTPLAILRAELELSRSHASGDELTRALDSALEETDRLGHLVDDLLLLARADAGHVTPRMLIWTSPRPPTGCCRASVPWPTDARSRFTRTGDAVVRADGRALGRALANLVDNAIRHAPDGGHVALTISQGADSTSISVTDDGPGVSSDDRDRMVQRFAQLDRSQSRGGGAGLGLSIVSAVAAAHDGRIELTQGPLGARSDRHHPPPRGGRIPSIRHRTRPSEAVTASRRIPRRMVADARAGVEVSRISRSSRQASADPDSSRIDRAPDVLWAPWGSNPQPAD